MRGSVEREYPETEGEKPLEEREGHVPESILRVLREIEAEKRQALDDAASTEAPAKRARMTSVQDDKNATPGNPSSTAEECLQNVQPVYVTLDRSAKSLSDPAQQRESAIRAFGDRDGDLKVHTHGKFVDTWESNYAPLAARYGL